ncbi:MAG: hypothetical protein KDD53_09825, partial [Bdellovibrionales bacterium]|nr:hypothetical protein [Bdellovibrionales bacterium]
TSSGYITGNGLSDFQNVAWDASTILAVPKISSPIIGAGDPTYATQLDITGVIRQGTLEAGAVDFK